jgi:NADH-quinone oxidoreductase subunit I
MSMLRESIDALKALISGLGITGSHAFKKKVTFEYPEHPKPVAERFKGRHILQRYANGLERCIGCALCAAACPADAIYVVPAENDPDHPNSPGERYAQVYEINLIRCIFCGFCEDACPVEAVVLKQNYELSDFSRESMIIGKDKLLVPEKDGFGENPYVGAMGPEGVLSLKNE